MRETPDGLESLDRSSPHRYTRPSSSKSSLYRYGFTLTSNVKNVVVPPFVKRPRNWVLWLSCYSIWHGVR